MSSNSASFSPGELCFIQDATQMSHSFRCQHPLTQVTSVTLSSLLPTVLAHLLQKQFPLCSQTLNNFLFSSLGTVHNLSSLFSHEPQVHTLLTRGICQPKNLPGSLGSLVLFWSLLIMPTPRAESRERISSPCPSTPCFVFYLYQLPPTATFPMVTSPQTASGSLQAHKEPLKTGNLH